MGHTTHTITIHYDTTTKQWSYTIVPAGNDAKNARVKRHDTVQWKSDDGTWTVYFKGPTPLGRARSSPMWAAPRAPPPAGK